MLSDWGVCFSVYKRHGWLARICQPMGAVYLAPVFPWSQRRFSYMGMRQDPMCSLTEDCVLAFISIMAGMPGFASHGSSLYLGAGCQ